MNSLLVGMHVVTNGIDMYQRFGFSDSDRPEEIIREIRDDVDEFVERLISGKPCPIIQEGKKASFLVSHSKTKIEDAGFVVHPLKYYETDESFFHDSLPVGRNVILLTDSIHTGKKLERVLGYLEHHNVHVKQLFSYLSNESGLDSLVESGLINRDQITSQHLTSGEKQYIRISRKLHVYYRSRIVPMDPDVAYDHYSISASMSHRDVFSLIRDSAKSSLGKVHFTKGDSSGLPKAVRTMGVDVKDFSGYNTILKTEGPMRLSYEVNYIHVAFKLRCEKDTTEFTVIPEVDVSCDFVDVGSEIVCLIGEGRICPILVEGHKGGGEVVCSACLGQVISDKVLDAIRPNMQAALSTATLPFRIEESRPKWTD